MRKVTKIGTLIILVTIFTFFQSPLLADTLQDYQKEIENIKNEQALNINKLDGLEKEIAQYQYDIAELDSRISEYSTKLSELQGKVEAVNEKIENYEAMLQDSSQKYNAAEDMYNTRLRAIYENGVPNVLDVLFSSAGITDFFSKMNVYQGILEYDKSLIGNVKN